MTPPLWLDTDGPIEAMLGTESGSVPLVGALTLATGTVLGVVAPFGATFSMGVQLALHDLDRDGRLELLLGSGAGMSPRVDVYTVGPGLLWRTRIEPLELPD